MSLAGLHEIPWARLTHAYGVAADVPDILERIVACEGADRAHAWSILFSTVLHQGTVYDATVFVLPFVIEWLDDETRDDRESIAAFVAASLAGQPMTKLGPAADRPRRIASSLHRIGDPVVASLVPWLEQGDEWTRTAVARAFARYPSRRAELLPPLRAARDREEDPETEAFMTEAIQRLEAGDADADREVLEADDATYGLLPPEPNGSMPTIAPPRRDWTGRNPFTDDGLDVMAFLAPARNSPRQMLAVIRQARPWFLLIGLIDLLFLVFASLAWKEGKDDVFPYAGSWTIAGLGFLVVLVGCAVRLVRNPVPSTLLVAIPFTAAGLWFSGRALAVSLSAGTLSAALGVVAIAGVLWSVAAKARQWEAWRADHPEEADAMLAPRPRGRRR